MSAKPLSEMLVVWTLGCGGRTVDVYENGVVDSDDVSLRERLERLLTEPVDVSRSGGDGRQIVLQPTDRRYVVARVRRVVADEPDLEMLGIRITGQ